MAFLVDDQVCQTRVINPWDHDSQYAPMPGNFGRTLSTLYLLSPTPDPISLQTQLDDLGFLLFAEWERWEENNYEEPEEQGFIQYTIARKLMIKHTTKAKETEQDLVIAPSEYWEKCLRRKINGLVHPKKCNQWVRLEDMSIVVSINHHNQGPLEKLYNYTNIDWKPVERQLCKWSNLVHMGQDASGCYHCQVHKC